MKKEFKKLTPKQKRRVESYMDMLEFHCDVRSMYYDSDRIELLDKVEGVFYKGYRESDKVTLNQMEKIYQSKVLKNKK